MFYDSRVRSGTARRALLIVATILSCFGVRPRPARANGRFPEAQRLLEHPGDPNRLYLAATFGLLVTEDRGKNWYTICEQAFALRFLEGDPLLEIMPDGALLGGIYDTLNRSSDCGCTWQTTLGASAKETIIDITIDRSRGSVLALVQDSTTFPSRFGVHESTDGGKTWRKLSDLPVEIVGAFTIDVAPSDSMRVYVTGVPTTVAGMAPDSLLAVSTDHGATWERRAIGGVPAGAAPYIAAVDPTNPDRLYARTDEWDDSAYFSANDALLYSDDGGRSWRELARHSAKLFGFALSPDGKTVLIGYGDPVDAGGRTTNSDDFGIYRASTTNFDFEKVFVAAINGLRWTSTGLYALITENHPERPTPGMSLGFSATAGFTLSTPNPFTSLLSVKNVRGPLACQAIVCGANWKDGTPDVAPLCNLLQASCDVDAGANALSCPGPTDGGAGGIRGRRCQRSRGRRGWRGRKRGRRRQGRRWGWRRWWQLGLRLLCCGPGRARPRGVRGSARDRRCAPAATPAAIASVHDPARCRRRRHRRRRVRWGGRRDDRAASGLREPRRPVFCRHREDDRRRRGNRADRVGGAGASRQQLHERMAAPRHGRGRRADRRRPGHRGALHGRPRPRRAQRHRRRSGRRRVPDRSVEPEDERPVGRDDEDHPGRRRGEPRRVLVLRAADVSRLVTRTRRGGSVGGLAALILVAMSPAYGCGGDARPACLSTVDVDACTPLYPAEFPVIFQQVLSVTCASAGVSCHGEAGRMGGLVFVDLAASYELLLGLTDGRARVRAGDAACSEMMVRLDMPGHAWSMPPGAPLDERARCSIRRWIADGALPTPAGAAP